MVFRLNSIKAYLDEDIIRYDNGESIELVTYLSMYDWDNPAPHSTEDAFKIGKVVKEYNITWEEIEEEALEHQFFYTIGNGLDAEADYNDADSDGNPIGLDFVLSANSVSSGSITFTLRHEPTKPNMGIEDAGGETDIEATFDIAIQ